jgi:hypothetical protein
MEQWEKELREKLEKELPEGMYNLSAGNMVCFGGKGAQINFEVALKKEANKIFKNEIIQQKKTGKGRKPLP